MPVAMNPRRTLRRLLTLCLIAAAFSVPSAARADDVNLLSNPGFEVGGADGTPIGWSPVWARTPSGATGTLDTTVTHAGQQSYKVVSTADTDWAIQYNDPITVRAGEIYTLGGWIKCQDEHHVELSIVERAADNSIIDWQFAEASLSGTHDWTHLTHRFLPDPGTATLIFRLVGDGTGTAWLDDASLTRETNGIPHNPHPGVVTMTNGTLTVYVDGATGTLTAFDRKSGVAWKQGSLSGLAVTDCVRSGSDTIRLSLLDTVDLLPLTATWHLHADGRGVDLALSGSGSMSQRLAYPAPFLPATADVLVVPNNEGLVYPAADTTVAAQDLPMFCGHTGLSMPWYGIATPAGAGVMTIVGTPDDAWMLLQRPTIRGPVAGVPDLLREVPAWEPQKQQFGYTRRLQYVFLDHGGYVAQAKAYRSVAVGENLVRTLSEKKAANPNVDRLIGSIDIWDWDPNPVAICKDLKSAGLDRVLWSNTQAAEDIRQINALGYLTSVYDNYQDIYPPGGRWDAHYTNGYPQDAYLGADGQPTVGWVDIEQVDGKQVQTTALASTGSRELARAEREIPGALATHPYTARFVDTTTASPWREDYSANHPLTRSEDRADKMQMLGFMSGREKLVTGSETGIDAAVPYVDYFEGMMSLAQYRLPDAGRTIDVYKPPTPDFLKYQVGPYYRAPLWELVYHNCVVSTWYWGDSSNIEPEAWDKRDLLNILYGTSPVFMLNHDRWTKDRARFVQTATNVCPIIRSVGYAQMVSHAFLNTDHTAQQTKWDNGEVITVNFGDKPYKLDGGPPIPAMGYFAMIDRTAAVDESTPVVHHTVHHRHVVEETTHHRRRRHHVEEEQPTPRHRHRRHHASDDEQPAPRHRRRHHSSDDQPAPRRHHRRHRG